MVLPPPRPGNTPEAPPNRVLSQNIALLRQVRERHQQERSRQQRVADAITSFAGSMQSVYLHATLFGTWLLVNTGIISQALVFDPYPFVMLAMFASVEAIFLSTFVLVSQNRQAELSTQRDELELQINLLAEHEITKLLVIADDIARHLGVPGKPLETDPLKREVAPDQVLQEIESADDGAGEDRDASRAES
jgi:uncharacterized membrane protein